jgi:site-specific DNA-methyltransferase (adenine-specific)
MTKELLGSLELNRIYQRDCLSDGGMALIPDKSIDMILCDLPYGTTACKWDTVLPFDKLWAQYGRIIKDNGAIVLTASQPFTSALVMSNPKLFKYELIWRKSRTSNPALAKSQPLRHHESILVFCKGKTPYIPQMEEGDSYKTRKGAGGRFAGSKVNKEDQKVEERKGRYPKSVLDFKSPYPNSIVHPTQKPVDLFEYLLRTYTNEGDIVLDNCMGSGTTAVAALNTNRRFIGFETGPAYIEIANKRIEGLIN